MRIGFAAMLLASGVMVCGTAHASGDMGCGVSVKPAATGYSDCNSTGLIVPGNDTRVNLALLAFDRHGTSPKIGAAVVDATQRAQLVVPFGWNELANRSQSAVEETDGSGLGTFSTGEGTTCVSNGSGQADFLQALDGERKLSPEERSYLAGTRKEMTCDGSSPRAIPGDASSAVRTEAGKQFFEYLQASASFYNGNYDAGDFIALAKSRQPWIREAATYMVGRTWALAAQAQGFGSYGDVEQDKMDRTALDNAQLALKTYLKNYPHGRYAASAYGLLRRVYWLGGDNVRLADAYGWQIDQQDPTLRNVDEIDLAAEIDNKLPVDAYAGKDIHPVLLAVDDLRQMRTGRTDDGGANLPTISRAALEAQKPRFADDVPLFEYLLAVHAFFVERQPGRVLQLIPAVVPGKSTSYLFFSRAMLRALALDATNDPAARDALTSLITRADRPYQRQTLEIALAMYDERHDGLSQVFASDSLVVDPALREILLRNAAGPELLRERTQPGNPGNEQSIALFTLLYKELTRGKYADFVADSKRIPHGATADTSSYTKLGAVPAWADFQWSGTSQGYACPALATIAQTLAKMPAAPRANLCLAEFIRLNGYDHFELDAQPPSDELGGTKSLFPGTSYSRQTTYQRVIADASAPPEDKAYALFRAVNCYAPSGANDCGGEEVPVAARKAWFNQLKSSYPNSPWAKSLRIYW